MKITIIKKRGKKETITRHPVEDIALFIQTGWRQHTVTELREMEIRQEASSEHDG